MKNAKTIEEVLASIAEQTLAEEERRSIEKPTPWFSLLHYPSRAAWRSTEYILGNPNDDQKQTENNNNNINNKKTSLLAQTQFNLLQHSKRTNKQLKRTYKRIMETHKSLAVERERERRLAANLSPAIVRGVRTHHHHHHRNSFEPDGSIEDGRGRTVGDWREKNKAGGSAVVAPSTSSPPLCDDPSVALSLSMGLYSSTNAYYFSSKRNNNIHHNSVDYFGDNKLNINNDHDHDDDDNVDPSTVTTMATTTTTTTEMNIKSAKSVHKLAKSKDITASNNLKPVSYGPEQAMTNVKYRLGPNYSIVKRVLSEVQSLLGGKGGETNNLSSGPNGGSGGDDDDNVRSSINGFRPKRVLDFGSGVGSASAAALDVFGVSRRSSSLLSSTKDSSDDGTGIDWIHSVDASQSMRESTEKVLKSILEGIPWEDAKHSENHDDIDVIQSEFDDPLDVEGLGSDKERRRLERRRKRMEKWEQTWNKRTDARTRLTFGESIADTSFSSSSLSQNNKGVNDDDFTSQLPPLPWQQQLDEQRKKVTMEKKRQSATLTRDQKSNGSFDLILCSYTLSELPSVPSGLAAAALLWEKLALDGVLVFVEPGTPDGFGMLRSVRSMLLECCPPPEIRLSRSGLKSNGAVASENGEGGSDNESSWPEECHVIAPCTHNGTCPMSRHQRDHVKRNSRFAKYEAAEPVDIEDTQHHNKQRRDGFTRKNEDDSDDEDEKEGTFQELLDEWDNMSVEDKEELKLMLGDGRDLSDEEMKAMLEYMDSMDDDGDDDEDDDDEQDSDDDESEEDEEPVRDHDAYSDDDSDAASQEFYNINDGTYKPSVKKSSTLEETGVFGSSFCSFVHTFPGGTSRKKGEKFSYLVLQKRVANSNIDECITNSSTDTETEHHHPTSLREIDIVEMLSQSVHHAQKMKKEALHQRLRQKDAASVNNGDINQDSPLFTYHDNKFNEILQKAVEVEDQFLDSAQDKLGLEMLHGDIRRKGWGRLIRAPLKRKGHVLLDYCSAGCTGGKHSGCSMSESISSSGTPSNNGTQGRIIRQKVSRGWSARTAPGCYSAARKARWGGLWPDLSERMKKEAD